MTGVHFSAEAVIRIFIFTTIFRWALGPTQPCIEWAPGALSWG